MKTLIAFLIGAAVTAAAADKDMYERFASTLIYADDFSNEEAHRLVADAMTSEDPEIVELALDAMGVKAFLESTGEDMAALHIGGIRPDIPDRALSEIPGLKDWLISRYREQHGEWSGDYSIIFSAKVPEEGPIDFVAVLAQKPGWAHIPYVLARGWPGDPDVHDLLLGDERLYEGVTLVSLLNQGEFVSAAADKERWDVLADADERRDLLMPATLGLAMSGDIDAIPHLLDLSESHPMTRHAVIKSLGGYDSGALAPHMERVKMLVEAGEKNPYGVPTSAGFYKLRSMVESADSGLEP